MFYFAKRGDLTLRYLVLIALGLIVLIIVAIIFSKGSSDFVSQIKDLWHQIMGLKPSINP